MTRIANNGQKHRPRSEGPSDAWGESTQRDQSQSRNHSSYRNAGSDLAGAYALTLIPQRKAERLSGRGGCECAEARNTNPGCRPKGASGRSAGRGPERTGSNYKRGSTGFAALLILSLFLLTSCGLCTSTAIRDAQRYEAKGYTALVGCYKLNLDGLIYGAFI